MLRPMISETTRALRRIQKQVRILSILRSEICGREAELLRLKAEESRLSHLIGDGNHPRGRPEAWWAY